MSSERLMRQIDRLSREGTIEGLRQVKPAQIDLTEALFSDGLSGPEIQQVLSRINNNMHRLVCEATLRRMAEEGWREPPVTATTIVMGSGGRGENNLTPDQDNGLILADYPDSKHAQINTFFIEMAERMCHDLDEIGIPYCKGYCMAVNPLWRKTLRQWIDQINLWGRKGDFVAIRLSDIFFDFQPVWGNPELAAELRHKATEMARHNHFFLKQMFGEQADHNVALGFFGGFITEREDQQYKGQVNLKYMGIIPLVEGVRLMALREGVEETSTLRRIRAFHDKGILTVRQKEDLASAFHFITDILLRTQIADYRAGRQVSYYVVPKSLSKGERIMLAESLKAINRFRNRLRLEFAAEVF